MQPYPASPAPRDHKETSLGLKPMKPWDKIQFFFLLNCYSQVFIPVAKTLTQALVKSKQVSVPWLHANMSYSHGRINPKIEAEASRPSPHTQSSPSSPHPSTQKLEFGVFMISRFLGSFFCFVCLFNVIKGSALLLVGSGVWGA